MNDVANSPVSMIRRWLTSGDRHLESRAILLLREQGHTQSQSYRLMLAFRPDISREAWNDMWLDAIASARPAEPEKELGVRKAKTF